jgi:hypothetical protein
MMENPERKCWTNKNRALGRIWALCTVSGECLLTKIIDAIDEYKLNEK